MLAEPAEPTLPYMRERMVEGTWGAAVCEIINLRELVLEFEIDERKKLQLEVLVERARAWKFPLAREDFVLEWTGKAKESTWEGESSSTTIVELKDLVTDATLGTPPGVRDMEEDYHFLKESPVPLNLPKRIYHVVKMTWDAKPQTRSME